MIARFFLYPEKNRSKISSKLIASSRSTLHPPSLYSSHFSKKWDFLLRKLYTKCTTNLLMSLTHGIMNSSTGLYLLMHDLQSRLMNKF